LPELTPERIAMGITTYVVLLFSLSVHESAHAWTAFRMGDTTAASLGRITLNPMAHIDPFGTVLMPLLQFFVGGIPLLAWAKPTPVQARNFKQGQLARGHILVAGAGPLSNLLLALLFTALLFLAVKLGAVTGNRQPLSILLHIGVVMNVFLAVFNLVPLPPLDGSWIASWALPRSIAAQYDSLMEPYGQWILLILFATGLLGAITSPISGFITNVLYRLVY
jgi:Zn-dependent protease